MKIIILIAILFCFADSSLAQSQQNEPRGRRIDRKNPYIPSQRHIRENEYKLHGYNDTTNLMYTTTAQCEMNCLELNEHILRKILKNGNVSVSKSELRSTPKKYTIEYFISRIGYTMVVIPVQSALLVSSLQRLNKKIDCDCD